MCLREGIVYEFLMVECFSLLFTRFEFTDFVYIQFHSNIANAQKNKMNHKNTSADWVWAKLWFIPISQSFSAKLIIQHVKFSLKFLSDFQSINPYKASLNHKFNIWKSLNRIKFGSKIWLFGKISYKEEIYNNCHNRNRPTSKSSFERNSISWLEVNSWRSSEANDSRVSSWKIQHLTLINKGVRIKFKQ